MNPWLAIFVCQFVFILLLGTQQANVHGGYKWRAAVTSLGLGLCQLVTMWFIPRATTPLEFGAFLLAGPVGIFTAMTVYPIKKSENKS